MKKIFSFIVLITLILSLTSCRNKTVSNTSQDTTSSQSQIENKLSTESIPSDDKQDGMTNITITVNNTVFSAKLYNNDAARALLAQFPMTLNMSDLNGNEKYYNLSVNLPSEFTEKPETMNAGELMCWSGNCLVLFYKPFSNSYEGYVRLGYIEDVSGLAETLGKGNIEILFSISD